MPDLVINGRFLSQPLSGVQRVALEITRAMEEQSAVGLSIVAPRKLRQAYPGKCLVQHHGRFEGHLWEQLELPRSLEGRVLINFCNSAPLSVTKQVVTVHDAAIVDAAKGYALSYKMYYRLLYAALRKRAAVIVTVSAWSRARLIECFGFPPSRIHVIHNGVDHILRTEADTTVLAESSLVPGRYVLAISSANPNKRTGDVEALVPDLERLGVRLVLVGGAGARPFRAATQSAHTSCALRLTGLSDPKLKALYENAAAFVSCSSHEGFGLPPLEACACGIPVIVSDIPAHREILGQDACYFPVGDRYALLRCLQRVVSDRIVASEARTAGPDRAGQFLWAKSAARYRALAEEIS